VGLRHFGDEDFFGFAGRLVFRAERFQKLLEGSGVFAWDYQLAAGETVLGGITRRSQFARESARTRGELRVLAVDGGAVRGCRNSVERGWEIEIVVEMGEIRELRRGERMVGFEGWLLDSGGKLLALEFGCLALGGAAAGA